MLCQFRLRRRRLRALTFSLDGRPECVRDARAQGQDPEQALVSREASRRIDDALAALPFALRSAVVLRDIEGLSYEEIAETLEVNIGTVRSRLSRGREALRERLRDLLAVRREARP